MANGRLAGGMRRPSALVLTALATVFTAAAQQGQKLETASFVVIGEGLAAGMGNYALSETIQRSSFPALIAQQIGTAFPQPLIQGPVFADPLGLPQLPVRMPTFPANSVRIFPDGKSPSLFVFNLAIPNLTLLDALTRKPVRPIIHDRDMQQTVINLITGFPQLLFDTEVPLWTPVEYATAMNPTLALVELGYHEVMSAAVAGNPAQIPSAAEFKTNYSNVLKRLKSNFSQVIATTIPDPMDTAYFTRVSDAATFLGSPPFVLLLGYGVNLDDYFSRNGLYAVGNQLGRFKLEQLPAQSVLRAAAAADLRARTRALNTAITEAARENGAVLYDMAALFARVKNTGVTVASTRLTGAYLGGFYTLDGIFPGRAGHALIANEILTLLNSTYGRNFTLVNTAAFVQSDPTTKFKPADHKEEYTLEMLTIDPSAKVIEQ